MTEHNSGAEAPADVPALPHPITRTDELLAAVHGVLVEIRDRLPDPPRPIEVGGHIDITESSDSTASTS